MLFRSHLFVRQCDCKISADFDAEECRTSAGSRGTRHRTRSSGDVLRGDARCERFLRLAAYAQSTQPQNTSRGMGQEPKGDKRRHLQCSFRVSSLQPHSKHRIRYFTILWGLTRGKSRSSAETARHSFVSQSSLFHHLFPRSHLAP